MRAIGAVVLGVVVGCAVGDRTVFTDHEGSLYGTDVFCDGDFEGIRMTMVPGASVTPVPPVVEGDRGCVELFMAQTRQGPFALELNEGMVVVGGQYLLTEDCSFEARADPRDSPRPLVAAQGTGTFEDGPEGRFKLDAELLFVDSSTLAARFGLIDVRRGFCDPTFF